MEDNAVNIEEYVSQAHYKRTLGVLLSQTPPDTLIGSRSPYTGKVIQTVPEAEFYLQQYAMSMTYRLAANKALSEINSRASEEIEYLQDQVDTLSESLKQDKEQIQVLESRFRSLEEKHAKTVFFAVLLCVILIIGCFAVPVKLQEQYDSGYNSGRALWVTPFKGSSGYSSTENNGGSSASRYSSYSSNSSDTKNYKTTPKPGYSLTMTVYVSKSGGKIHRDSGCSGMLYYDTMTYGEACEKGYSHCSKCF